MNWRRIGPILIAASLLVGGVASSIVAFSTVPTTLRDFHVPGTQSTDLAPENFLDSSHCAGCHAGHDTDNAPYDTWKGSLMGVAALDPLFQAQVALANQDAPGVGYYCLRCHAPNSIISGNAFGTTVASLEGSDFDGVSCHLCHSMVDPRYEEGVSPAVDESILSSLEEVPEHFGNSMFVLDPSGLRRGPRANHMAAHEVAVSSFYKDGAMCGTCHDVGNVAVSRRPDGSWIYNSLDEASPSHNPHEQFPLERTFSEWRLSDFANGGVDMKGRFGGEGAGVVSTCQDCHMPKASASATGFSPVRPDLARHEFAGATAWVLEIVALQYASDPRIDLEAIERGRLAAIDMLKRAARLELSTRGAEFHVRVVNEAGHKLPTGHIEGRRAWLNVKFKDGQGELLQEFGHYDYSEAHLDAESTHVYEMLVGISEEASTITGLPVGITGHMSLANTIEKDTRIPPRGYNREAFAAAGAPAVGVNYADGQHWDDAIFMIPQGAVHAEVRLFYQTVTRHYIEELRDNNHTDDSGDILYDLWLQTNKAAPIEMVSSTLNVTGFGTDGWSLY